MSLARTVAASIVLIVSSTSSAGTTPSVSSVDWTSEMVPMITVRMLLKSWARPPARRPMLSRRWACRSCSSLIRASVTSIVMESSQMFPSSPRTGRARLVPPAHLTRAVSHAVLDVVPGARRDRLPQLVLERGTILVHDDLHQTRAAVPPRRCPDRAP